MSRTPDENSLAGTSIGFIGLGLMGRPMARNLARAGAALHIYNRSQAATDELAAEGMKPADSPKKVAEKSQFIIIMVSDTAAVNAVLFGDDGVLAGLEPGSTVIDMGTTAVSETAAFAEAVMDAGCHYVDAPVSGGTIGAGNGTLSILVGASEDAFKRALPIFNVLGERVTHVGDVGAGQIAKAANQVIVGLTIGAVAEALTLAKRAGADPARVREALRGGFADSRILELHGERMVKGTFEPGGKCVTQRKDLHQALELAAELGLDLPITDLVKGLYDDLIARGHGELDHSALIKAIDV